MIYQAGLAASGLPLRIEALLLIPLVVIAMGLVLFLLTRLRRCPPNRVLVIYGNNLPAGAMNQTRFVRGGTAFVWPLFQACDYLDIDAFNVAVKQTDAVSRDDARILVSMNVTAAISPEAGMVEKAAAKLLGMAKPQVLSIVEGLLVAKMRAVLAEVPIEELKRDRRAVQKRIGRAASDKLAEIGVAVIVLDVSGLDFKDAPAPQDVG